MASGPTKDKPWHGTSIRLRLITTIAVVLILGFLLTNLTSFQIAKETLKTSILHNELPLISNNIYSEIQADLLRPILISSLMANDTFVKDWLRAGEKDRDNIKRYLDEIRIKYDLFTTFLISDKTHNYYHFSGLAQVIDEQDPEDAWYFRCRHLTSPYEINVDYNQAQDDRITVFVNYRLLDEEGHFLGITGTGLDMASVSRAIERYQNDYGRSLYFVDREGEIKLRSSKALLSENNIKNAIGISKIAGKILGNKEGSLEYRRGSDTLLLRFRLIPELNWYIMVEQQERAAMQDIRKGFLANLAAGLGITLGIVLVIAYTINIFQSRLENMATIDKLTGLANRQVFDLALGQALALFKRKSQPFVIILLDIDHFKWINDSLGHLTGDEVIRKVAEILRAQVRSSDLVSRWGGEEFIVLIQECDHAQGQEIAEKLRIAVSEASILEETRSQQVTISAGFTESQEEDRPDDILSRADQALYKAKTGGRNQACG